MRKWKGREREAQGLYAKFHLNVFIVLASGGQNTILGKFGGLLYRPPFTYEGQIWCAIADTAHVYVSSFDRRKTPIIAVFGLRHLVMSTVGGNLRKLTTGTQLTNLPLSKGIKIIAVLQRIHREIGRTN